MQNRILLPVYDNEKENWRMLTNKEMYAMLKKTHYNRDSKVEKRIPQKVLHMNVETTNLRGQPRNRWQDEVRDDGILVGGEVWQEGKGI